MRADLITIDLDGTLLTPERNPHPASVSAIERAISAGMIVVLASGRIRPSMLPYAETIGVTQPMICSNGGQVIGPDGQELSADLLDKRVMDQVLAYSEATGVHVSVYTRDELLYLRETDWGHAYVRRVRSTMPTIVTSEEARARDVLKVLIIDHPEQIQEHLRALAPVLDPEQCRMTESEPEYLEFLPPQVSKGRALQILAGSLGIPMNRTAAIGDYLNDLEMITVAGHSAAVANGAEATRLAAHQVVPSNAEGGVGVFIDWLLGADE